MRTHRHIVLNQRQHVLQHRHHAGLVALAGHDQHVAGAGQRHVAALQAERFGDAQARAVQQRHHGGVARPDPGIAVFAGALVGVGEALGRRHLDRFRQALADLGRADRRQRADLAFAFPFEEAPERAQARQRPHQRAAADIVGAPHRHEGPDVAGLERGKARQRHPRAPMLAEKDQTLADVAGIGLRASSATAAVRRADATASASSAARCRRRRSRVRSVGSAGAAWPSWLFGRAMIGRLYRTSFVYRSLTAPTGALADRRVSDRRRPISCLGSQPFEPDFRWTTPRAPASHPHRRRASSMCWCRSRSIRPIPTGCRAAWN